MDSNRYLSWARESTAVEVSFECCVHSVGLHQQADNKKRVTGKDELGQGNTEKMIKKYNNNNNK